MEESERALVIICFLFFTLPHSDATTCTIISNSITVASGVTCELPTGASVDDVTIHGTATIPDDGNVFTLTANDFYASSSGQILADGIGSNSQSGPGAGTSGGSGGLCFSILFVSLFVIAVCFYPFLFDGCLTLLLLLLIIAPESIFRR